MGLLSRLFRHPPPESAKQLNRNDPCWCGSGKKYKKCHYEDDRKYFSQHERIICKGPT